MFHPQTNGQADQYNKTLTSMLHFNVNDNQSDWDAYSSALTQVYSSQVYRSTNSRSFDLELNRRIKRPKFYYFTVYWKNASCC